MNELLGGATLAAFLAAAWRQIKMVLSRCTSVVFVRIQVRSDVANAMANYCWRTMRRSPFGDIEYDAAHEFVRSLGKVQVIGYESVGRDPVIFWQGWKPLLVGLRGGGNEAGQSLSVTCIRGMFKADDLVIAALDRYNKRRETGFGNVVKRYYIARYAGRGRAAMFGSGNDSPYNSHSTGKSAAPISSLQMSVLSGDVRIIKWKQEEVGPEIHEEYTALSLLYFPPDVSDLVVELRRWKDSEKWYKTKRIPWRRGVMLLGEPGTGKTSLVRAIGEDLDLPVFIFDIGTMTNAEFVRYWEEEMLTRTPCIALVEDIDAVFNGRTNVAYPEGGLTFDCLLNCISGVKNSDGVLLFVTTNDVSKVDSAIGVPVIVDGQETHQSTRPGRIDRTFRLPKLDEENRRKMAARILSDCLERLDETVDIGSGDTGAQFQERCAAVALAHHWSNEQTFNRVGSSVARDRDRIPQH